MGFFFMNFTIICSNSEHVVPFITLKMKIWEGLSFKE